MNPLEKQAEHYAQELLIGKPSVLNILSVHRFLRNAFVAGCAYERQKKNPPPPKFEKEVAEIIAYLSEKTDRQFRGTKESVKNIRARLAEPDVTLEGVKKMIDRQVEKWTGTEFEEYLTPLTLFRPSKFNAYYSAKDMPVKPGKDPGHLIYE